MKRPVPKKFYVAMPFNSNTAAGLANGELIGIAGISDRADIIMQWYGMSRDAVLAMDGEKLSKLNNLSVVQYRNPEYLLSNGMAALFRLLDKNRSRLGAEQVAGRLVDHFGYGMKEQQTTLPDLKPVQLALQTAHDRLTGALTGLPDDRDDRRQLLRQASTDEGDLKYLASELMKMIENIESFSEYTTESDLNIYLKPSAITTVTDHFDGVTDTDTAVSNAQDYGFDDDAVTKLVDVVEAIQQAMRAFSAVKNVHDELQQHYKSKNNLGQLSYNIRNKRTRIEEVLGKEYQNVKTAAGLAKILAKNIPVIEEQDWLSFVKIALSSIGRIYAGEGEWLVKDRRLKIPEGSVLWVTTHKSSIDPTVPYVNKWAQDKEAELDSVINEYGLDKKYRLLRIDASRFDNARSKWANRAQNKVAGAADNDERDPLPENDLDALQMWADWDLEEDEIEEVKKRLEKYEKVEIPVLHQVLDDTYVVDRHVVTVDGDDVEVDEMNDWLTSQGDSFGWFDKIADALAERFNIEFAEEPAVLYHVTPKKNLPSIMKKGLLPQSQSRGLTNRSIGNAIFTVDDPDFTSDSYGDTILEIDVPAMKRDGVHFSVEKEPAVFEKEAAEALAWALGAEDFYWEVGGDGADDPATVILYAEVDPKYLKVVDKQGKTVSGSAVPKDFRLYFHLPNKEVPDLIYQLDRGILEGVTGITDSGTALMLRMLGTNRNAMLIMPADEVLSKNAATRVTYDDPDSLMANDMAMALRVMGRSHTKESTIRRILYEASHDKRVKDFVKRWEMLDVPYATDELAKLPLNSPEDFGIELHRLSQPYVQEKVKKSKESGLDDDFIQERFGDLQDSMSYIRAVTRGLLAFGKSFVWEGEWVLQDKKLRIPEGSRLFVLDHPQTRRILEGTAVSKKYNLRFVDEEKMRKAGWNLGKFASRVVEERWPEEA